MDSRECNGSATDQAFLELLRFCRQFCHCVSVFLQHRCSSYYVSSRLEYPSTMAPKQSKCALVATDSCGAIRQFMGIMLTKLEDICMDDSSGWRELEEGHVAHLIAQMLEGKAGNTTLARPSIRCDHAGHLVSAIAGRY
jgi:hypothetical protein